MAAKDSLVIGKVFGGAGGAGQNNKRCSTTAKRYEKGCGSKKGAAYPALRKTQRFLRQLSDVFVDATRAIRKLRKLLVSLIGLTVVAAVLVSIVQTVWLGKPLPVESLISPIVRDFISRTSKK